MSPDAGRRTSADHLGSLDQSGGRATLDHLDHLDHLDRFVELSDDSLAHDLLVLRASVAECVVRGQGSVTVDLSALTRVSSVAVAALLWARRSCGSRSVAFRVEHARGSRNRQVLQRCGLLSSTADSGATW